MAVFDGGYGRLGKAAAVTDEDKMTKDGSSKDGV